MEGGSGAVDVITGKVPASGRLSDTIAYHIDDYPSTGIWLWGYHSIWRRYLCRLPLFETFAKEKVRYPFGYGLSYTTFDVQAALDMCSLPAGLAKGEVSKTDTLHVTYDITNTGDVQVRKQYSFMYKSHKVFLESRLASLFVLQRLNFLNLVRVKAVFLRLTFMHFPPTMTAALQDMRFATCLRKAPIQF